MGWIFLFILIIALIYLANKNGYLVSNKKGVAVLMYHKVSVDKSDFLTVTADQLSQQLQFLKQNKYDCITCQQWIDANENPIVLPPNPVLITFDDGYLNNFELALPILKEQNVKATIFLPSAFIGKNNEWDGGCEKLMTLNQIKVVDLNIVEWALHTHTHQNFKNLSLVEMENELKQNMLFLKDNDIKFTKALAYPYGGRPKNKILLNKMKAMFVENDLKMALRIGNNINNIKPNDIFEIKRIDISGIDSFADFKLKLKKGKIKLF